MPTNTSSRSAAAAASSSHDPSYSHVSSTQRSRSTSLSGALGGGLGGGGSPADSISGALTAPIPMMGDGAGMGMRGAVSGRGDTTIFREEDDESHQHHQQQSLLNPPAPNGGTSGSVGGRGASTAGSGVGGGGGGCSGGSPLESWPNTVHTPSGEPAIWVLDPMTRKLLVPIRYIIETQATQVPGSVPSLCMSFLEGRCVHTWCRQAHVQPDKIHELRQNAQNAPTCCASHGDPHDLSSLMTRFDAIHITDSVGWERIACDKIALTVGLRRYLVQHYPVSTSNPHNTSTSAVNTSTTRNDSREASSSAYPAPAPLPPAAASSPLGGSTTSSPPHHYHQHPAAPQSQPRTLELPSRLICRLHLSHRCRYLEDCNNIHVCRDLILCIAPPPPLQAILAAIGPNTARQVTIADVTYKVHTLATGDVSEADFAHLCEQYKRTIAMSTIGGGGGGGGGGASSQLNESVGSAWDTTASSPPLFSVGGPDDNHHLSSQHHSHPHQSRHHDPFGMDPFGGGIGRSAMQLVGGGGAGGLSAGTSPARGSSLVGPPQLPSTTTQVPSHQQQGIIELLMHADEALPLGGTHRHATNTNASSPAASVSNYSQIGTLLPPAGHSHAATTHHLATAAAAASRGGGSFAVTSGTSPTLPATGLHSSTTHSHYNTVPVPVSHPPHTRIYDARTSSAAQQQQARGTSPSPAHTASSATPLHGTTPIIGHALSPLDEHQNSSRSHGHGYNSHNSHHRDRDRERGDHQQNGVSPLSIGGSWQMGSAQRSGMSNNASFSREPSSAPFGGGGGGGGQPSPAPPKALTPLAAPWGPEEMAASRAAAAAAANRRQGDSPLVAAISTTTTTTTTNATMAPENQQEQHSLPVASTAVVTGGGAALSGPTYSQIARGRRGSQPPTAATAGAMGHSNSGGSGALPASCPWAPSTTSRRQQVQQAQGASASPAAGARRHHQHAASAAEHCPSVSSLPMGLPTGIE